MEHELESALEAPSYPSVRELIQASPGAKPVWWPGSNPRFVGSDFLGVSMATLPRGGAAHDPAPVVSPIPGRASTESARERPDRAGKASIGRPLRLASGRGVRAAVRVVPCSTACDRGVRRSCRRERRATRRKAEQQPEREHRRCAAATQSVVTSNVAELVIDAPSAASAFVLAGSLADYGARAVVEDGVWRVVVQRCSASGAGLPGALSHVRRWLADCGFPTTSVTLDGETYLLDGSLDGSANGKRRNGTSAGQKTD